MLFCTLQYKIAGQDTYLKNISLRNRGANRTVIVEVFHFLFLRYMKADPSFKVNYLPTYLSAYQSFPITYSALHALS